MTKFSVNLKAHYDKLVGAVEKYNSQPDIKEKLDLKLILERDYPYINDPVVGVMCRITRIAAHHMDAFHTTLRNASLFKDWWITPVDGKLTAFMQSKTPGNIIVFPNLYFNPVDDDTTVNISPLKQASVYNVFMLMRLIEEYKKADNRGWLPLKRALRRLTARQEMSIAAYITRYTNASKQGHSSANIRDLAENIADIFKPVELTFADTPEDFIAMYGNKDGPSSCMTMHESRPWQFMLDEWEVHPTSFYAYHPHTRGAYLKKGKKIVARCICYEIAPKKWQAGRMYFTNSAIAAKFMEGLRKAGIDPHEGKSMTYTRDFEFEMPLFRGKSGSGIPVPYMDNIAIGATFTLDGEKVIVKSDPKGNTEVLRTTAGYIPLSKLQGYKCHYCDATVNAPILAADTSGFAFCHEKHANLSGYFYAKDSRGHIKLLKQETLTEARYLDSTKVVRFTTEDAARRSGAGPIAELDPDLEMALENEDTELHYAPESMWNGYANGRLVAKQLMASRVVPSVINFSYRKEVNVSGQMCEPLFCDDYLVDEADNVPDTTKPYPEATPKSPKKTSVKKIIFNNSPTWS